MQAKRPPYQFSPVTSTNVGISPQNILTFSFNPFATLVENFKFVPNVSLKLLNVNQDHPSEKAVFLVKSNEVVISSLKEMLELPNFGHINKSTIQFESRDINLLVTPSTGIMKS